MKLALPKVGDNWRPRGVIFNWKITSVQDICFLFVNKCSQPGAAFNYAFFNYLLNMKFRRV